MMGIETPWLVVICVVVFAFLREVLRKKEANVKDLERMLDQAQHVIDQYRTLNDDVARAKHFTDGILKKAVEEPRKVEKQATDEHMQEVERRVRSFIRQQAEHDANKPQKYPRDRTGDVVVKVENPDVQAARQEERQDAK